jgi:YNFM family putative membrane transporter
VTAPSGTGTARVSHRRIAVAVVSGGVATFASLYSTQALLPDLGRTFGLDAGAAAWSVSVATLGMAAGLTASGPLSDRFGRSPFMRWSLLATALLDLLAVAAPTWTVLLWLRGAQGLALSCYPAAATAYLREEVAAERHARVSGLYIGGTALGGMLGRMVAALGAQAGGWRAGLAAVAALTAVCALACWTLLPPSRRFLPSSPSTRGSTARTAARLARDPVLTGLWALGGLSMGAFASVFMTIGFRLESAPYDVGVAFVGAVFSVYAFGSVASGWAGRAVERWGRPGVVRAGTAILLAGLAVTLSRPLPLIVVGLVIVTCGFFTVHSVASGWVAARAQVYAATGQASAIYLVVYYLGSSLAGGAAGRLWTAGGWQGVCLLSGSLGLTAVVIAAALAVRSRTDDFG